MAKMKRYLGVLGWMMTALAGAVLAGASPEARGQARVMPEADEIKSQNSASTSERVGGSDRVALQFQVPRGSRLLTARNSPTVVGFREWSDYDGRVATYEVLTNRLLGVSPRGVPDDMSYQTQLMLASDGLRLMAWTDGYSEYSENNVEARVWNVRSALPEGRVSFTKVGRVDFVDFYGKDKAIFYTVNPRSSRKRVGKIEFWDYKEKSLIEALPVDYEGTQGLALDTKRERLWVATSLRDDAGRVEVTAVDLKTYQTTNDRLTLSGAKQVVGMAISPDGSRLAVMFEAGDTGGWGEKYKVCIFNLETSQAVVSKAALSSFPRRLDSLERMTRTMQTGVPNIQWSGNSKWLLLGRNSIVDAATASEAALVGDLPGYSRDPYSDIPNMFIGPDSLLKVVKAQSRPNSYNNDMIAVSGYRLPLEVLNKGIEEATTRPSAQERSDNYQSQLTSRNVSGRNSYNSSQSGNSGSSGQSSYSNTAATSYPVLSKVDADSLTKGRAPLVIPEGLPKTVTPDPGPVLAVSPMTVSPGAIDPKAGGGESAATPIRTIDLSGMRPEMIYSNGWSAELGITQSLRGIAVTSGVNSRYAALSGRLDYLGTSGEYCMGMVVDMAYAKPTRTFAIPKGGVIGALSADGDRVAIYTGVGSELRIDVYDLEEGTKSLKHVVGWTAGWNRPIAFLDSDHLLVAHTLPGMGVSCYRLSNLALEYSVPGSRWTLSPGREQLFIATNGQMLCLDAKTGKPLAKLDALLTVDSGFASEVASMAVDPTGSQLLFMVTRKDGGNLLQLIDLKTGRRIAQHNYYSAFDKTWGGIQSVDATHFMLGGRVLVETPDIVPVGFLKAPVPVVFYGDEVWNFADSAGHWRRTATGARLDLAKMKAPLGVRRLEDLVVFRTPTSVRVELGERPKMDDIAAVERALIESMENKSITVTPDADLVIRIDTPVTRESRDTSSAKFVKQPDGSSKWVPIKEELVYLHPEVKLMRGQTLLAVSPKLDKGMLDYVVNDPDLDAERKNRQIREGYQGAIIKAVWRTVPAVLMDYGRLGGFNPWPGLPDTEANTSNPWVLPEKEVKEAKPVVTEAVAPPVPAEPELSYEEMRVELKALKAFKVVADDWAKDSETMVTGATGGAIDPRKFRIQLDDLSANVRKLALPSEKVSDPMNKSMTKIKEAATTMTKAYNQAMSAFAARNAGRWTPVSSNEYMYQAKTAYDTQYKPAAQAITNRIADIEAKIR